jgi:hypothetical protein
VPAQICADENFSLTRSVRHPFGVPCLVRFSHFHPLTSLLHIGTLAKDLAPELKTRLNRMCTLRGIVSQVGQVDIRQKYIMLECTNEGCSGKFTDRLMDVTGQQRCTQQQKMRGTTNAIGALTLLTTPSCCVRRHVGSAGVPERPVYPPCIACGYSLSAGSHPPHSDVDSSHQVIILSNRGQTNDPSEFKVIEVQLWDAHECGRLRVGAKVEITGLLVSRVDGEHQETICFIAHHVRPVDGTSIEHLIKLEDQYRTIIAREVR